MPRAQCQHAANLLPAGGDTVLVAFDSTAAPMFRDILISFTDNKHRLKSVPQLQELLKEVLTQDEATWVLAYMNADSFNILKEYSLKIEARVMNVTHIPPSITKSITYKLTPQTIRSLVDCYGANLDEPRKDQLRGQLKRFYYRTNFDALKGLKYDGSGDLSRSKGEEVKDSLRSFLYSLLPRLSPPMATAALSHLPRASPIIPVIDPPLFGPAKALPISESINTGNTMCWPSSVIEWNQGTGKLVPMSKGLQTRSSCAYVPEVGSPSSSSSFDITEPSHWYQFPGVFANEGYVMWSLETPGSGYYES